MREKVKKRRKKGGTGPSYDEQVELRFEFRKTKVKFSELGSKLRKQATLKQNRKYEKENEAKERTKSL